MSSSSTTLQDVRRLAVELRPKALDDFGLVPALERLVETFREQTGIKVDLEPRLGESGSAEVETTLYRIVQEALTNIVKHAQASHVSIVLTRRTASIAAVIEDDGQGFDESAGRTVSGCIGMRERVALVGGGSRSSPASGSGTTLVDRGSGRMTIRVLIVDDHAVVRSGLRHVLEAEDDIEVVAEAGDAARSRLRGPRARSRTSS